MDAELIYERKGQAAGAVGSIVVLITGVGVSVMVLIFVGALGGQTYQLVEGDLDTIGNHAVTAEAFTPLNGTKVSLANSPLQNGTLTLYNASSSVLGLGNFTFNNADSGLTLLNNSYNNTAWFANYTYGDIAVQHSVKNGIISGFEALEQTGDYLPIIVLAVVISLVLMLVLGFTAFGGRGGGINSAL